MINGLLTIRSKRQTKKLSNKIILKRKELKINKKKMISIPNMKEWIMPHYWRISKQPSSKPYIKYKWGSTSQKPGIILLFQFIITMEIAYTSVNFVCLSLTFLNNWKDTLKDAHCSIRQVMKFIETKKKKLQYFKLMD